MSLGIKEFQDSQTLNIEDIIDMAIQAKLVNMHVMIHGYIVDYDVVKKTATCQPGAKRKYPNGTIRNMPPVQGCPVMHPGSGKSRIHIPVHAGDSCLIGFSERSLDRWLEQGGSVDTGDVRMFDLSDGICIPGLRTVGENFTVEDPDAIEIQNDKTRIRVKPNGKVSIKNLDSGKELISTLFDLVQAIQDARVATSLGPQPLVNPAFATLQADIGTLKE